MTDGDYRTVAVRIRQELVDALEAIAGSGDGPST